MRHYVTIDANFEAAAALLTACELATRLIDRPHPTAQRPLEVTPTPTAP